MKDLGYHEGYQYAHSVPEAYIPQEYLPEELRGSVFYEPGPFGFEKEVAKRLQWWADLKAKVSTPASTEGDKRTSVDGLNKEASTQRTLHEANNESPTTRSDNSKEK
jgi:hypothetical protein